MSKFFLLLVCMAAQDLNASQIAQTQPKAKHIFEQFEHGLFVDSMLDFLIKTKRGRFFLLQFRVAEIDREMTAGETVSNTFKCSNFTYTASSSLYESLVDRVVHNFFQFKTKRVYPSNNKVKILIAGIAALETALIEQVSGLSIPHQQLLEKSRVHDLYLAKLTLENDNNKGIEIAEPYSLPEILASTHQQWPPEHCKDCVHPTSAYTVIKEALEQRKAKNIDAYNDDGVVEQFSCKLIQVPKQESQGNRDE